MDIHDDIITFFLFQVRSIIMDFSINTMSCEYMYVLIETVENKELP